MHVSKTPAFAAQQKERLHLAATRQDRAQVVASAADSGSASAEIFGRVTDVIGMGVPEVMVVAQSYVDEHDRYRSARTDAHGEYRLSALASGTMFLSIHEPPREF